MRIEKSTETKRASGVFPHAGGDVPGVTFRGLGARERPVGGGFLRVSESLCILKSDQHEKTGPAGCTMRDAFLVFEHLLVNVAKLVGPGGSKGLLAETLLVKHQLIVLNRSRRRAPNLTTWDRFLFGLIGADVLSTELASSLPGRSASARLQEGLR